MIKFQINGADALAARLNALPPRLNAALAAAAGQMLNDLAAQIRAGPLSGGVLQARSGRLAADLSVEVSQADDGIAATIGDDAPYARFQEMGFRGAEAVRASLRTMREAFGRPIPARSVAVRAHNRVIDYPGRPFLGPALADAADALRDGFADAIDSLLDDAP